MVTPSDLQPFLSQKPIVLLVEDRVTKGYLAEVWGRDEQFFNILTVGGSNTVKGMVEDSLPTMPGNSPTIPLMPCLPGSYRSHAPVSADSTGPRPADAQRLRWTALAAMLPCPSVGAARGR